MLHFTQNIDSCGSLYLQVSLLRPASALAKKDAGALSSRGARVATYVLLHAELVVCIVEKYIET